VIERTLVIFAFGVIWAIALYWLVYESDFGPVVSRLAFGSLALFGFAGCAGLMAWTYA
jgi:hypothetical protein